MVTGDHHSERFALNVANNSVDNSLGNRKAAPMKGGLLLFELITGAIDGSRSGRYDRS